MVKFKDKGWSNIHVKLSSIHRFKEIFSVHPRESYNDIIERANEQGALIPPTEEKGDEPNEDYSEETKVKRYGRTYTHEPPRKTGNSKTKELYEQAKKDAEKHGGYY